MNKEEEIKKLKKRRSALVKIVNAPIYDETKRKAEKEYSEVLDKLKELGWRDEYLMQKEEADKLTISERAVSYLFGQMKLKGISVSKEGKQLNYKLMWIVDFLSSEISNQLGYSEAKKGEMVLFKNLKEFNKTVGDIVEGRYTPEESVVEFEFKASEVRKWLGFSSNKMPLKNIVGLFEGLASVMFKAISEPVLYDPEKKAWQRMTFIRPLYFLDIKERGNIISNRWKTRDTVLRLKFGGDNVMSWLFLANLSTKRIMSLPKAARHELDEYEQNLLREFRIWKTPRPYFVGELAKIAGLKYKEAYRLIEAIKAKLETLRRKKYIKSFITKGIGKATTFTIIKEKL